MKILDFQERITKTTKVLEFHQTINKLMKIVESEVRKTKIMKIIEFHVRKNRNNENPVILNKNKENHKNVRIPLDNY